MAAATPASKVGYYINDTGNRVISFYMGDEPPTEQYVWRGNAWVHLPDPWYLMDRLIKGEVGFDGPFPDPPDGVFPFPVKEPPPPLTAGGPGSGRYPKGSGKKYAKRVPSDADIARAYDAIVAEYGPPEWGITHPRGDVETAALLDAANYNGPPTVLSTADFEATDGVDLPYDSESGPRETFQRAGHHPLMYTNLVDSPPDEHFCGRGIYGCGTYVGNPVTTRTFGDFPSGTPLPLNTTLGSDVDPHTFIRCKIKSEAKVVDWLDIPQEVRWEADPSNITVERWAVDNGYDVINVSQMGDELAGVNVLNRNMLIIERA